MSAIAHTRRRSTLLALTLASLAALPGIARAQAQFPAPERKKMQEILNGVRKQITEQYYDSLYGGVNLAAAYDSASAHIASAAAPSGAIGAVSWFALQLNDSHTYFAPPATTVNVEYGWDSAMFGDSCFVTYVNSKSDAAHQGVHPGDLVVSVNGYPPTRASLWQINYLYRMLQPQRALHVALRSPDGSMRQLDLAARVRERGGIVDLTGSDGGRDIGQLTREEDKVARQLRGLTIDVGDQVLVWKMPSFEIPYDEVHDALKRAHNRKGLVIDLRGNGGGFVDAMLELMKQVNRDSVFVGTLRERRKTTPLVAKRGGDDAFSGPIIVLVDSRSASASEIFARTLQLTGRGKVIGDHTEGAVMQARFFPMSIGLDMKTFYGVQVTNADVIMSDGGRLEKVGVTPDEILLPTAADLAASRDPALARAISLAGMPMDATRAGALYPKKPDSE